MKRTKLQYCDLIIEYEFRENCNILIFANFTDIKVNQLADEIPLNGEEVQEISKIIKYDSGQSAIVVNMKPGYKMHLVDKQIEKSFNKITQCQN